jgi:N-acetylmuramoyl-L-alanine amidase
LAAGVPHPDNRHRPGHGGEDRGTAAAGGLAEKELTLAVARRLKAAIEGGSACACS